MHLHASLDRPVPVYMAANGPKALELAGEIADGVITVAGIAPDLVERMRMRVGAGAERVGRTWTRSISASAPSATSPTTSARRHGS